MLKRAMILLGLMAFTLTTSGVASSLHHAIEHADPAKSCHTSDDSHAPDHHDSPSDAPSDTDEECDLCATIAGARHALIDLDPPAAVALELAAHVDRPLARVFIPGVSLTTGPPRGPPSAA